MDNQNINPVIHIKDRNIYVASTDMPNPYDLKTLVDIKAVDQFGMDITNTLIINTDRINFAVPGIYNVSLSVADRHGNISSDYLKVHVLSDKDVRRVEKGKPPLQENHGNADNYSDDQSEKSESVKDKLLGWTHKRDHEESSLTPSKPRHPQQTQHQPRQNHQRPTNDRHPRPRKGPSRRSQSKKKKWIIGLIVALLILIISGTLLYVHHANSIRSESFHEVQVSDNNKKYSHEADILIAQLKDAASAYKDNGNRSMYLKTVRDVQSNSYDLQTTLNYKEQNGNSSTTLNYKLQILTTTAQEMELAKTPSAAMKAYKDSYGGYHVIPRGIDNLVINMGGN